ncbi:MAG: hypothetical protein QOE36_2310 [Gaiellaceae bacterium]|jgi:hypothetical protein|nr:hypothetical protein [Gaiellaceae bacterium]
MEAVLAFAAALVALRLAGALATRWRGTHRPELAAWAAALFAYAAASGAIAWGTAAGWDARSFRIYYLCGALLTAPLLGVGSLLLSGRRWAGPVGLLYAGLAVGIAISVPLAHAPGGHAIPGAQNELDFFPARLLAVLGNTFGTLAVVAIALSTLGRRPLGNTLIVAGVAVAAAGSALTGLGVTGTAVTIALAAGLLYAGFVAPASRAAS